jgi:hypothetical protein
VKRLTSILLLVAFPLLAEAGKKEDRQQLLAHLGAAHAANLFNSYTAMGALADGFSRKAYSKKELREMLFAQRGMIETLQGSLNALSKMDDLAKDDVAAVTEILEVYALLDLEAVALLKYMESRNDEDLRAYDEARNQAWSRIERLLGLPTPPAVQKGEVSAEEAPTPSPTAQP